MIYPTAQEFKDFQTEWNSYNSDWNKGARDIFKVRLDPKQEEILHSIQLNRKISVCSGVARGKDFLAATASMCFLYFVPYWDENGIFQSATVINTAPSERQVINIMMREIRSRYSGSLLPQLAGYGINSGRLLTQGIKFDMPEAVKGKKEYANIEKWYMIAFKADDHNTEAWTGFHNTNIMIVATEASGLSKTLFDGMTGCLQGNSKFLIVYNPNNTSGESYNSSRDPQYKFFRLNSLDSPNVILGSKLKTGLITNEEYKKQSIPGQVDYQWIDEHIHKPGWTLRITKDEFDESKSDFEFEGLYYRPSDICRIKILGQSPEAGEDTLIPLIWIEQAQERWLEHYHEKGGKVIRGVDIAGMGADTTVACDRDGDYVPALKVFQPKDNNTSHMEALGWLKSNIEDYEATIIDAIGEGAGVYSRAMEQKTKAFYSFKGSYSAAGLTDRTTARKFMNMRQYCIWCVRDWLDPKFDSNAMLPPDDELKMQMIEVRWKYRSDGTIEIEPKDEIKKRLGVSPDKFDALSMTFAPLNRLRTDTTSSRAPVRGAMFQ